VLLTGIHLMQTGEVEANLVTLNERFQLPYIPELIERKVSGTEHRTLDDADVDFHEREYARLVARLESARDESHLPESETCKPAMNDLLLSIRGIAR